MSSTPHDSLTTESGRGRGAAKVALAAGGLLAAFGAASCCALPIALSILGISAVSLTGVGLLAAPVQRELFIGAIVLVAAAGIVMWRQRAVRSCTPGTACTRPTLDWITRIAMAKAVILLALAWWIAPPL